MNAPRSVGAIALSMSPNENGFFRFMSLDTGEKINRRKFTELPITEVVIKRVEAIAEREGQPKIKNGCPLFEWEVGITIDNDKNQEDYDKDYEYTPDDDYEFYEDDYEEEESDEPDKQEVIVNNEVNNRQRADDAPANVINEDERHDGSNNNDNDNVEIENEDEDVAAMEREPETEDALEPNADAEQHEEQQGNADHGDQRSADTDNAEQRSANRDDAEAQRSASRPYNLRSYKGRTYNHIFGDQQETNFLQSATTFSYNLYCGNQESDEDKFGVQFLQHSIENVHEKPGDFYEYVCHLMFNQMPAKKGIEKHGQVAVDAMLKEFSQLDGMSVFEGIDVSTLTTAQKKEALRAIKLIKEKRCGTVKRRAVADGRAQRGKYDKNNISSPTVTNEGQLMMSLIIDAMEKQEVVTADVPGAYLHAEMGNFTILKLTGEMVDIFCQMNKKYEQYVTIEGGKKVLYLKLLKALYRCIRSAMLWYNLFTGVLVKDGFELNPYDPCIANKQVDEKQLTVAWYIDDLKMSHVDRAVLKKLIKKIEEDFGNIKPVFGKSHDYL